MQIIIEIEAIDFRYRFETGSADDARALLSLAEKRDVPSGPLGIPVPPAPEEKTADAYRAEADRESSKKQAAAAAAMEKAAQKAAKPVEPAPAPKPAEPSPEEVIARVSKVSMDAYARDRVAVRALLKEFKVTKFEELEKNIPALIEFGAKVAQL